MIIYDNYKDFIKDTIQHMAVSLVFGIGLGAMIGFYISSDKIREAENEKEFAVKKLSEFDCKKFVHSEALGIKK